ncbi:sensor histidine kinase [Aureibaculum luteum]|uniref:sensor histidine kinase n=1 Tax=Aureibaculum luteum TaxID=1548456 RepID=UPI000E4EA01A|nr:histidine kinase [Aureibaculum luteum]
MKLIKKQYNFNFFEPFIIIAFWILLFASPLLFGPFEDGIDWNHIFEVWKNNLPLLGLYLIHRFLLMPKLFFKGKKVFYFVITLGIIITITSVLYIFGDTTGRQKMTPPERVERHIENSPQRISEMEPPPPPQSIEKNGGRIPVYANFIILAVLLVGFDAGLQISMRWSTLEQEKTSLQKESVENQLAFLRNQISPHFFMNTLNNIHALVDIDTVEAKDAIIKLSNLMRHLLYDSEEKFTPIKKEVKFIQSYIELMRLRFSDKVKINVEIPSEIPDTSIPPLLFTSLLENAFKHGISYNKESFITIIMNFTDEQLQFSIENSNHVKERDGASGIGIENTKKRLALLFQESFDLKVSETKGIYKVNLNIPI